MRPARILWLTVAGMLATTGLALPAGAQPLGMVLWAFPDPASRFTIEFPLGWQVHTSRGGRPAIAGTGPGNGAAVRPTVNVDVETLPSPQSSEAFAQRALQAMRTMYREFTVVQQGPTQIVSLPAYFRYYTWRTPADVVLYQVQVYLSLGTRAFVITGTTRNAPEPLQKDFPVIVRIIGTFHPSPLP